MASLITKGNTTFSVGDILRIKDAENDEWMRVTAVTDNSHYTVQRDLAGSYASNNNPTWGKGTAIVNYGQSTDGGVYMTASDSNSPYLSVFNSGSTPWNGVNTYIRLGNLSGFLDYSETLFGIAIGESTKYLKYDPTNGLRILGSSVISSSSGARIEMFPDANTGLIAYDDSSNEIFKVLVGGANVGDVVIGDYSGGQYVYYDKSEGTMTFGGGGLTNLADRGYVTTIVFSATDEDTAAWSSGSIKFSDGTTKSIDAGNTGNIGATTYVYFDDDVSQTVLQTTTTYSSAIGENKLLLAIVEIGTSQCLITTSPILGTVISGTAIATGTITANKLSVSQLDAICVNTGTLNVDESITVGTAGKVIIDGANEIIKVYDASNNLRVEIGKLP